MLMTLNSNFWKPRNISTQNHSRSQNKMSKMSFSPSLYKTVCLRIYHRLCSIRTFIQTMEDIEKIIIYKNYKMWLKYRFIYYLLIVSLMQRLYLIISSTFPDREFKVSILNYDFSNLSMHGEQVRNIYISSVILEAIFMMKISYFNNSVFVLQLFKNNIFLQSKHSTIFRIATIIYNSQYYSYRFVSGKISQLLINY